MGFCDLPVAGALCDATPGGIASSITGSIGNWIASSIGDLAASGVNLASEGINATTAVDLNAGWFRTNYELLLPIGLVMTVATFVLQLMRAAWRRDGDALVKAVAGTFAGVLFAFSAIAMTTVALAVVDALSAGLFSVADTNTADAIRRLVKISEIAGAGQLGWAVAAIVAVGCAIGTFLYWGMMIFRKVTILIMVTLAVFAGAGGGWDAAQRWRRGWIELTATMVASKLLMTIVFLLGVSAIGEPSTAGGISALSDLMAGIVIMLLVLLCPFATYRFIHWAADGTAQSAEMHQTAAAGLNDATAKGKKAASYAQSAAAGGAGAAAGASAGAGGGGGSPQGPDTVPGQTSGSDADSDQSQQQSSAPTTFRFGEDAGTTGPLPALIKRPSESGDGGQSLITRQGSSSPAAARVQGVTSEAVGQLTTAPSRSGSGSPPAPSPQGAEPAAGWAPPEG